MKARACEMKARACEMKVRAREMKARACEMKVRVGETMVRARETMVRAREMKVRAREVARGSRRGSCEARPVWPRLPAHGEARHFFHHACGATSFFMAATTPSMSTVGESDWNQAKAGSGAAKIRST